MKHIQMLRNSSIEALQIKAQKKGQYLERIFQWRDTTAQMLKLAPEHLMKEALIYKIAYSSATSVEALSSCGLRISQNEIENLSNNLEAWLIELHIKEETESHNTMNDASSMNNQDDQIIFEEGNIEPVVTTKEYIIKTGKKPPSWLESFAKFDKDKRSIEAIATERGILSSTIIGHILDAFEHGCAVDFVRLHRENMKLGNLGRPLPTFAICKKFEEVQNNLNFNIEQVCKEYSCKKSILENVGVEGLDEVLSAKHDELTPAQSTLKSIWYGYMNWWTVLKATKLYDKLLQKSIERAHTRTQMTVAAPVSASMNMSSPSAGISWSFDDDQFLWTNQSRPMKDLSDHFNRTVGAIRSRLGHLRNPNHSAYKRLSSFATQQAGQNQDTENTRNAIVLDFDSPSSKRQRSDDQQPL